MLFPLGDVAGFGGAGTETELNLLLSMSGQWFVVLV